MLHVNKSAAIADPPSTSDVQYGHIRYPPKNVGQRFCWKTLWTIANSSDVTLEYGERELRMRRGNQDICAVGLAIS